MLESVVWILLGATAIGVVIVSWRLRRGLQVTKAPQYVSEIGHETDLPTVSVCIPARNERHALLPCLEAVLASTYERLEVIVLDDVSGDDTSALIKSFASEGVRFVKGKPLEKGWLGKNHALQGLLEQASGSYILFMDVDTRLQPQAIEQVVRYAFAQRAKMVSVLPRRDDGWRASVIMSPLRYFWALLFHTNAHPSTASSAWLIHRETLTRQYGGFEQLKAIVQPEARLAALLAQNNAYRFLLSSSRLGVSYEKKWRSQLLTSHRLLFPSLGGSVLLSIVASGGLLLILTPIVVLILSIAGILKVSVSVLPISALLVLLWAAIYGNYTFRVWRSGWWLGALLWPVVVVQELCLIIASVTSYKRRAIRWKGRLIRPEVQS